MTARPGHLLGLKENVIIGHLVPAGTGLRKYRDVVVGSKEELEALQAANDMLDRGLSTDFVPGMTPDDDDQAIAAINRRLG